MHILINLVIYTLNSGEKSDEQIRPLTKSLA